jgi:hypothetical protein
MSWRSPAELTEALNHKEEEFGDERLKNLLRRFILVKVM